MSKCYYVNVYSAGRAYGGPEEGGWWYDYGIPDGESIRCDTLDKAQEVQRELLARYHEYNEAHEPIQNVHGDGVIVVYIEAHHAREFPKTRPFYS